MDVIVFSIKKALFLFLCWRQNAFHIKTVLIFWFKTTKKKSLRDYSNGQFYACKYVKG